VSIPARRPEPPRVRTLLFVCHGPSCTERGSPETCRLLREGVAASPAQGVLHVCETTCLDSCATGPNLAIGHDAGLHTGVTAERAERFLDALLGGLGAGR
jgi:NADH:ubiquinone oxidoreductase subunit E